MRKGGADIHLVHPNFRTLQMSVISTNTGQFRLTRYSSESDLEAAIAKLQKQLFGGDRVYIDVKRRIGSKTGPKNIPDGYLIDLSGNKPRLFVVENELASHDPLRHIAVQILQFSLSFEAEPRAIKNILHEALQKQKEAFQQCEQYASAHGFRNLDHFLETLVFETPFSALVIIDEIPENLESILARKFQFGVEVLELARYENSTGEHAYRFEPFLADLDHPDQEELSPEAARHRRVPNLDEIDTVVVPAREEGFEEVFLRENRWYAVRIHGAMRPQLKYIAAYRVAPVSAITHIAPVRNIEAWKDSDKFVLNFSERPREIGPITLVKGGHVNAPQNLRYTNKDTLLKAKTLDDVW